MHGAAARVGFREGYEETLSESGNIALGDFSGGAGGTTGVCVGPGAQDSARRTGAGVVRAGNREYCFRVGDGKEFFFAIPERDGTDGLVVASVSLAGGGNLPGLRKFHPRIFFCSGFP